MRSALPLATLLVPAALAGCSALTEEPPTPAPTLTPALAAYESGDTIYGYRTDPNSDRFRLRSRYVIISGPVEDRQAFDVLSALRYSQGYASTVIFTGDWGAVGVIEHDGESLLDYRATGQSSSRWPRWTRPTPASAPR